MKIQLRNPRRDVDMPGPLRVDVILRRLDIERETELGGPFHSKGVLILANFLATRYSHNVPLSLSASLVFGMTISTASSVTTVVPRQLISFTLPICSRLSSNWIQSPTAKG